MLKTVVRTTACLAVSAAALIAVTKLDAFAGSRRRTSGPETSAPESAAPPKSTAPKPAPKPPAPAPTTPKLTAASVAMPATTAAAAATGPGRAPGLIVPDWKGKRLSVVRREARKLGFNVKAVDESGETIPAAEASSYRVRRQLTKAGTEVALGADVEVRAREVFDAAEGY
jgi:cytoskeletal protein RodZ